MRYGVTTARRGWLEKKDVVNTLPLPEFLAALRPKPGAAAPHENAAAPSERAAAVPTRRRRTASLRRKPAEKSSPPSAGQRKRPVRPSKNRGKTVVISNRRSGVILSDGFQLYSTQATPIASTRKNPDASRTLLTTRCLYGRPEGISGPFASQTIPRCKLHSRTTPRFEAYSDLPQFCNSPSAFPHDRDLCSALAKACGAQ